MSIFRETKIEWDGVKYTLVPSMRLLHAIETGDKSKGIEPISLASVTNDALNGHPQVAKMAHIVEVVMRHAGAEKFTEDEFYQEMTVGNNKNAVDCWHAIVAAISPVPKEGKEVAAQDKK